MRWLCVAMLGVLLCAGCKTLDTCATAADAVAVIPVGPFGTTGDVDQQGAIQQCLDSVHGKPAVFRFAPGEYLLTDAGGLRVPAHATLLLEGARFLLGPAIAQDGQAFLLNNVSGVTIRGGEIVGRRDAWDAGTNVAGVRVLGGGADIRIEGLVCRDLSSNAVGVFAKDGAEPIRNVELIGVVGVNCCNVYTDYLLPNKGPAPGSDRMDQGTVALYNVDGWLVEACRFEKSQSDGTHFFHCRNGRFANSTVTGSRMGGYFLEGCSHVIAVGSHFQGNGSRGVTIERDSRFCTVSACIVSHSGREGAWLPDVEAVLLTGNLFEENGQKDDGEKDCEIRLDDSEDYAAVTKDVRIEGNIFRTGANQTATILFGPGMSESGVGDNTFSGPAPHTGRGVKKS